MRLFSLRGKRDEAASLLRVSGPVNRLLRAVRGGPNAGRYRGVVVARRYVFFPGMVVGGTCRVKSWDSGGQ
jgi:hypothetical protein